MAVKDIYADLASQFVSMDEELAKGLGVRRKPPQAGTPFLDYQMQKQGDEKGPVNTDTVTPPEPPRGNQPPQEPQESFAGLTTAQMEKRTAQLQVQQPSGFLSRMGQGLGLLGQDIIQKAISTPPGQWAATPHEVPLWVSRYGQVIPLEVLNELAVLGMAIPPLAEMGASAPMLRQAVLEAKNAARLGKAGVSRVAQEIPPIARELATSEAGMVKLGGEGKIPKVPEITPAIPKAEAGIKKVSDEFFIYTASAGTGEKTFTAIKAKPVQIPGYEGYDFFIHRPLIDIGGKQGTEGWVITEGKTGMKAVVRSESTQTAAIKQVQANLERAGGKDKLDQLLSDAKEISPRYGGTPTAKEAPPISEVKPTSLPKVKPTAVEVPLVKEPWQMTKQEVQQAIETKGGIFKDGEGKVWINTGKKEEAGLTYLRKFKNQETGETVDASMRQFHDIHENAVKEALVSGKPVPPEVLKDYPDLTKTLVKEVPPVVSEGGIPPVKPPTPPPGIVLPPQPPIPPTPGSPLSKIQGMLQTEPSKARDWSEIGLKLQENINDSYYGLRRMQGQRTQSQTIQPGGERDIISAITRAPGAANAGITRYELAVASMKKLAPDANITDISTILFSEHGKEILAAKGAKRVLPGGINTTAGLDQALTELQAKLGPQKYQQAYKAAEIVKDVYATERQRLVDSGLISKELGDALAKEYPWYNPLRYLDYVEAEAAKGKSVRPISVSSSGLRRLSEVGSEKAILDPLSSLPQELVKNEVRIQKNDLAKGIIKVGMEDPKLGITKRKITVPVAQVEGEPVFRPQHGEIPGTLSFFENGTRQVYDVPEWMYREAAVLNQSVANPVASLIGGLNGISRAAFTTFSPAFTVANMFNDMLPAMVRGGVLPTATARRLVLSFKSLETDPLMQAYRLSGAYQGRFYGKDAAEIAKQVGASGGTVIGKHFNLKKAVLDAIPSFGEKGEQASRQAVFEKNLNKTLPKWKSMTAEEISVTPQARKAAADAVEATINFGRGGYLIRSANPFVIFINASMEGTKLPFRTLRDSARSRWTLAGLGAGVAGLTAYNMSYPEYFDVADRVRWGSVMIMLPSTKMDLNGKPAPKYLTIIPNTREWATFFAPLTYGMEKAFKDNPTDLKQFAQAIIPQVSPVGNLPIPQIASEIAEQAANYDFYTGFPIISQGKTNLPATEQTGPYVSTSVEKGSQAVGVSPLRVQHALSSLFGGAGNAVTSVLDLAVGAKNKRGLELQTQYNAVPNAKKAEWINKLSSADKSALTAATNQAQQSTPVVSPIVGRFYHERGGQLTQNDWTRFDKTVEDTNKRFAEIPRVAALGIKLGSVGTSFDLRPGVTGGSVDLTPAQRADFQRIRGEIVTPGVKRVVATMGTTLSPENQKKAIQTVKDRLEAQARTKFLQVYRTGQTATIASPTTLTPLTTNLQKWDAIRAVGGKDGLIALNKVWYENKPLPAVEENQLKGIFAKYPFGQTNYETWKKQTMRQIFENSLVGK